MRAQREADEHARQHAALERAVIDAAKAYAQTARGLPELLAAVRALVEHEVARG